MMLYAILQEMNWDPSAGFQARNVVTSVGSTWYGEIGEEILGGLGHRWTFLDHTSCKKILEKYGNTRNMDENWMKNG